MFYFITEESSVKSLEWPFILKSWYIIYPFLWNIICDGMLKLRLPAHAELTAFKNEVAISIIAKHIEEKH